MCVRVCVGEGVDRRCGYAAFTQDRHGAKKGDLHSLTGGTFQRAGINPAYARVQLREGAGA